MTKTPKQTQKSPAELPRRAETWLLTVRKLSRWVEMSDGLPTRPYLILLLNQEREQVLDYEFNSEQPEPSEVQNLLWRAMLQPARELRLPPHRPQEILCDEVGLVEALAEKLAQAGVAFKYQAENEVMDDVVAMLEEELGEPSERPGLLTGSESTPELVGDLFAAAAQAFRQEPWIYLSTEQPLKYSIPRLNKTGFMQLMGNSAIEYGLLLYESWQELEQSYLNTGDPRPTLPKSGWVSFSYTTPDLMSPEDLQAIKAYGWELADEDAYPMPMVMFEDHVERPDAGYLQTFTALLRAIPEFVTLLEPDLQGDYLPLNMDIMVSAVNGELVVRLEYPAGQLRREAFPATIALDEIDELDEESGNKAGSGKQLEFTLLERGLKDNWDESESRVPDESPVETTDEEESLADWQSSPIAARNPALVQAMSLIYEAWEDYDPGQRIALARQALELSPDCAEAYCLLADELAVNVGQALKYYQKGVEAGERALGVTFFSDFAGQFWEHVEARPYLRARAGLARTLWELDRNVEALEHLYELLRLDASDALECRYGILLILLEMDRFTETYAFARAHSDETTTWKYTLALLEFQLNGDNNAARDKLTEAIQANPHVPNYLSGRVRLPSSSPPEAQPGQKSEAITYASSFIQYWRQAPGAIDWLRKISRAGDRTEKKVHPVAKRKRRK